MLRGTLVSQVIAIIGAIYLAKIYGEEAYGFFSVFMSIIGITSIISTLQLDKCIVISKDEKESANWFSALLILILSVVILISFLTVILSNFIDFTASYKKILGLSLLGTLIVSINLLNTSFFTFKKEFSIISNAKIFITISNVFIQFILFKTYNILGLMIGFLISQLILTTYYLYKNRKSIDKPNFNKIKIGVKSNSSIINFLLPSNVINALANNLMPILILSFFGAKEAGVYFFSIKILGAPFFLISSSISQVFFQKSAELYKEDKKELLRLSKKIVKTNLLLMFAFLIVINTLGIYVLEIYFDNNWTNLRLYLLILSVLILSRVSFSPISSLIVVLNKNLTSLIFNIYLFAVNLIAIYIGYFYDSMLHTISILAIFSGIGYIFLLLYFLNNLKNISNNNV